MAMIIYTDHKADVAFAAVARALGKPAPDIRLRDPAEKAFRAVEEALKGYDPAFPPTHVTNPKKIEQLAVRAVADAIIPKQASRFAAFLPFLK